MRKDDKLLSLLKDVYVDSKDPVQVTLIKKISNLTFGGSRKMGKKSVANSKSEMPCKCKHVSVVVTRTQRCKQDTHALVRWLITEMLTDLFKY